MRHLAVRELRVRAGRGRANGGAPGAGPAALAALRTRGPGPGRGLSPHGSLFTTAFLRQDPKSNVASGSVSSASGQSAGWVLYPSWRLPEKEKGKRDVAHVL